MIKDSNTNVIFDKIIRESSLREGASMRSYLYWTDAERVLSTSCLRKMKKEIYRFSIRRYLC